MPLLLCSSLFDEIGQRAACACAACCDDQRSALHKPLQRAPFFVPAIFFLPLGLKDLQSYGGTSLSIGQCVVVMSEVVTTAGRYHIERMLPLWPHLA